MCWYVAAGHAFLTDRSTLCAILRCVVLLSSGPFRYDYTTGGRWVYHRDGRDMLKQIEAELEGLLGAAPPSLG